MLAVYVHPRTNSYWNYSRLYVLNYRAIYATLMAQAPVVGALLGRQRQGVAQAGAALTLFCATVALVITPVALTVN